MPTIHHTLEIDVDALAPGDVVYRAGASAPNLVLTVDSVAFDTDVDPCVTIDGFRKHGMWLVTYAGGLFEYHADGSTVTVIVDDPDAYDPDALTRYRPVLTAGTTMVVEP